MSQPETFPITMGSAVADELIELVHAEVTKDRFLGPIDDRAIASFVVAMICGDDENPKANEPAVAAEVTELFANSMDPADAQPVATAFMRAVWVMTTGLCQRHGLLPPGTGRTRRAHLRHRALNSS